MKKRNLIIAIGLSIFLWMTMAGGYINNNPDVTPIIYIYGLRDFCTIAFVMLAFPVINFRINHYDNEKKESILKWNILLTLGFLLVVDIFSMGGIYDETFEKLGARLIYSIIFFFINKQIFIINHNEKITHLLCNIKLCNTLRCRKNIFQRHP